MSARAGQVAVSAALLALGIAMAAGTYLLPNTTGYAQVGPRLFPGLIAGGLILISLLLLGQALFTGFRNAPDRAGKRFDWGAFAWLSAGVAAQMALIAHLGFILTSTLLFFTVARAFGSRRTPRDVLLGLVLATLVYFLFTQALTLSLPWGSLVPGDPADS